MFGHTPYTFLDAQRHCEHYGARLVSIESSAEYNFIRGFLMILSDSKHWIGLTDETTEGTWNYYPSEQTANFLNWHPSQPEQGTGANCAAIVQNSIINTLTSRVFISFSRYVNSSMWCPCIG
ncbi:hypothetical protein DPMN_182848 [Dreissena polymorpha]|uniref:C-type lectin domain-containing protein n=1 Tax=Dreissena polymorpha TaxID=45954 RepID=A0A9D4I5T8_DREPO|nr:hypothetical protein DPMN_182848 [Dreissena polymorpha]